MGRLQLLNKCYPEIPLKESQISLSLQQQKELIFETRITKSSINIFQPDRLLLNPYQEQLQCCFEKVITKMQNSTEVAQHQTAKQNINFIIHKAEFLNKLEKVNFQLTTQSKSNYSNPNY
ncbi:unnamed protein product [Paramecium octaurelia]|uniref:Uncharacterized protein n=1 Tax=Paramecium octaurelia TaxID=43137 RepID=A0A8S1YLG6_PAROT|nr:unnamed protein product [Paramecium octaurelia]